VDRIRVRDDLTRLEGYHSPQVSVSVRLNTNEAPEPPPLAWRDALVAELSRIDWHRYPDRAAAELRAALADLHGVHPEQVFVANGSNEVLQVLLLAYGGHGRTVATFEPTYQMHGQIARVTGAKVVEGERAADFTLDLDEAKRVVVEHSPSVTFLCSPNNPTGLIEPESHVRALLELFTSPDGVPGLLVVDEAYGQFSDWSALSMIADHVPLVVVRTFSKTWSMAAARLGYLIGPRSVVAALDMVTLPYHLDAVKQVAGRLALRYETEMLDRVDRLVAERERVSAAMRSLPIDVVPSSANFVLFRPRTMGGRELWQALLDRDVLVRDCSGWPRLADRLRVTIGTAAENDAFLEALTEVLTS
jgi:histidinol-phosphate aminotransferase